MPLEKSQAYVSIEGLGEASLEQMENWFLEELKAEDAASGKAIGFPNNFPDETKKALTDFHNETLNMVEELIKTYVTSDMMVGTIEGLEEHAYIKFDPGNPLNAENDGEFGTFLERTLFGGRGDDRPTADIDIFRNQVLDMKKAVEVKAKEGSRDITAGSITVYGLPEVLTDIELKTVHNIAMVYKMMIKMQNFLYLNMKKNNIKGEPVLGFRAMVLYTSLYLRALYRIITYGPSSMYGSVSIDVKQPKQPTKKQQAAGKPKKPPRIDRPEYNEAAATYSIPYDIEMNFDHHGVILKGIENIAKLYLRNTNIIDELHSGGISAAQFFGRLRKINGFLKLD
jgi:hypothetical protein